MVGSIKDPETREALGHVDEFLREVSQGFGRVTRGQVPNSSGALIIDQEISSNYFYLPGRQGGQVGYGGVDPGDILELRSTSNPFRAAATDLGFIKVLSGLVSSDNILVMGRIGGPGSAEQQAFRMTRDGQMFMGTSTTAGVLNIGWNAGGTVLALGTSASSNYATFTPTSTTFNIAFTGGSGQVNWTAGVTDFNGRVIVDGAADVVQFTVEANATQTVNVVNIVGDGGAGTSSDRLLTIGASGTVGIGSTTQSASAVKLDIRAINTQSANLIQCVDSAGDTLFSAGSRGAFTFGSYADAARLAAVVRWEVRQSQNAGGTDNGQTSDLFRVVYWNQSSSAIRCLSDASLQLGSTSTAAGVAAVKLRLVGGTAQSEDLMWVLPQGVSSSEANATMRVDEFGNLALSGADGTKASLVIQKSQASNDTLFGFTMRPRSSGNNSFAFSWDGQIYSYYNEAASSTPGSGAVAIRRYSAASVEKGIEFSSSSAQIFSFDLVTSLSAFSRTVWVIPSNAAGALVNDGSGVLSWDSAIVTFDGFANPTASVGLTVVNGTATTAMRSDAAPPLSQAIAPTWTAAHIWNSGTTPTDAITLGMSASGLFVTRDSHALVMRGAGGANPDTVDWKQFVDVTSDSAASSWTLQSRIAAAAYATRLTLSDAGALTVASLVLTTPLPIGSGGTGQATATAAFNALSPLTTRGDLLTNDGTNDIRLAIGADGWAFHTDGVDPSWVLNPGWLGDHTWIDCRPVIKGVAAGPLPIQWWNTASGANLSLYIGPSYVISTTNFNANIEVPNIPGQPPITGSGSNPPTATQVLGKVNLTGQTANIASTNLTTGAPAGMYQIQAYLVCEVAQAGASVLTLNFAWNDGAARTDTLTRGMAATGTSSISKVIYLASGNISYSITGYIDPGGAPVTAYGLRIRVTFVGT